MSAPTEQQEIEQELDGSDPLILVGCVLEAQKAEGGKMRRALVAGFKNGRYKLEWTKSGKVKKLQPQQLLRRKIRVLEGSGRQPPRRWSDCERAALTARRRAEEIYMSIGLSFGRSEKSVTNSSARLLSPKYTPPLPEGQPRQARHEVGWRRITAMALRTLPESSGTSKQIQEVVQSMPEVSGKLDCAPSPSLLNVLRWEKAVQKCLSTNPEFRKVGKQGSASVWQLDETRVPAKPGKFGEQAIAQVKATQEDQRKIEAARERQETEDKPAKTNSSDGSNSSSGESSEDESPQAAKQTKARQRVKEEAKERKSEQEVQQQQQEVQQQPADRLTFCIINGPKCKQFPAMANYCPTCGKGQCTDAMLEAREKADKAAEGEQAERRAKRKARKQAEEEARQQAEEQAKEKAEEQARQEVDRKAVKKARKRARQQEHAEEEARQRAKKRARRKAEKDREIQFNSELQALLLQLQTEQTRTLYWLTRTQEQQVELQVLSSRLLKLKQEPQVQVKREINQESAEDRP